MIKNTNYTLSVKPFAFKKDYFTVDPKIVEGTVGNSDATTEFKNKVAPLYDLFEPSELWTGSFILPVTGAKTVHPTLETCAMSTALHDPNPSRWNRLCDRLRNADLCQQYRQSSIC